VSVAGSPYRWAILAGCVAVFEAVALAIAMFARETGRRSAV
jgi:hypothetical protein